MGIIEIAAIVTAVATVIGVAAAIFLRQRQASHRASGAGVVAPDNEGTISTRGNTTVAGQGISADRSAKVEQHNYGLAGDDHDRLVRIEKALGEIARGTAVPGMSAPQTTELAAEAGADTEEKLREAVAFVHEGRYKDAIEHVRSAYDRDLPPRARAQLYSIEGNAYLLLSEYGAAEAHYKQAIQAALESDNRKAEAVALGSLGLVYANRGDLEGAEEHHRKALDIAEEIGDRSCQANQLGNLGNMYAERSDLEGAEEHYRKALDIFEEIGDRLGQANQLGSLGIVYKDRGELKGAEEHYRKALDIHEEIGDRLGQARDFGNLGNVYKNRGELKRAEEYHRRALEIDEEIGNRLSQAQDLGNLGSVYAKRGDLEGAEEHYRSALEIAEEIGAEDLVRRTRDFLEKLKATDD